MADAATAVDLTAWVGRSETLEDHITPVPARALAATLDRTTPTDELPPLWHWLYFLPLAPMAGVGPDGHPKRGGFLPPVPLERRMWAAGSLTFHDRQLRPGDTITRTSTIRSVTEKAGKSGPMVFVTVDHVVSVGGETAVEEQQDIVYLAMPDRFTPPPATPLPDAPDWTEPRPIDPVFLFRFSALTFNGHRIHYDLAYATEVEKYPGLVVHGPLQALLLAEAAGRHAPGRRMRRFAFRAMRPLFGHDMVILAGKGDQLFTATAEGAIGMQATVTFAD